jgi:hypothetical protein
LAIGGIYILKVSPDRRDKLLKGGARWRSGPQAAEPVPTFDHSRRAPLLVLASFEDGFLTHITDARKGQSAGTDLVRLNLMQLEGIDRQIPFKEILERVQPRFRKRLGEILEEGGLLPPKTMRELVDVLSSVRPKLVHRLDRLSTSRAAMIAELTPHERENLAVQKEALSSALAIAGVGTREVLEWTPGRAEARTSFLEGLPEATVREDVMLSADFTSLPGFAAIADLPHIAARTFQSEEDPSVRVTIVMANRLPLEQQTGADLVYYNEQYRSFVLVQYKALEKADPEHEFRWQDGDQFADEIKRMDDVLAELNKIEPDLDPDGYRFTNNPFFLKFCSRLVFNPDDRGLFPGMYLPLDLWKLLAADGRLKGPRGGNVLTFANVGRKLSGTEFIPLVAGSWVGTTITQSASLEAVIRSVVETGKTVTFAVKRAPSSDSAPVLMPLTDPLFGEGAEAEQEKVSVTS